ncbi:MAG: CDP-diacylglycerol--serine O-phosphatidyltransferase [Bacillota bacterium]
MRQKRPTQLDWWRPKWRIRSVRGGKWWRERGEKGLSMIPHLFTLANLAFGIIAIVLTMRGDFRNASLMVVGCLIADGLDGRLARMLKADGEFGKELDSLADVVSFGTAPAILLYEMSMHQLGYFGLAVTILFPLCGALRLARFNIIKTSGFFMGVPITAAGTLLSTLAFYTVQETTQEPLPFVIPAVVILLAYLMTSTIPYPDFKKREKGAGIRFWPVVGPVLVVTILLYSAGWNPWALLLMPLAGYVALGPWLYVLKHWSEKVQPWLVRR